MSIEIFMTHDI